MVLESFEKLQERLIEYWTSMEKKKRLRVVSISVIILISATLLILMLTRTKYSTLYGDLSLKDMGEITSKLDEMDISWKTGTNQKSIMVPDKMKGKIKIELATYGLPKDGYDYMDAFNDTGWTMTEYDKKQRMKLADRSQLASKISEIDGILNAEVFINEKESTNFVLQNDDTKTTASIYIETIGEQPISLEKVKSIRHLVAGAVSMKAEDVIVIDDDGRLLGEQNDGDIFATDVYLINQKLETRINHSIIKFLENIVGFGNVDVMTSVKINMDSQKTTIVEFAPPIEGDEEGLVRSLEEIEEHMVGGQAGGVAGVDSNNPDDYMMLDDSSNRYDKVSKIINNELNQINKEIRRAPGQVESITVAVLINKDALLDGEMTAQKEKEFVDLIYAATGLDTKQVQVKAESFNKYESETLIKGSSINWLYILLPLLIVLVIVATFIIYIRRITKKDSQSLEKLLVEKSMVDNDVEDLEFQAEESKMKLQIESFIERNPETVVQLLRNWLNE